MYIHLVDRNGVILRIKNILTLVIAKNISMDIFQLATFKIICILYIYILP